MATELLLVLLVAVLGTLLAIQVRQRRQLMKWLENPDAGDPPDGSGAWRKIFTRLQQLRKEERSVRNSLAASRDCFRLAVETIPDGVILLNHDGSIDWLNAEAARHFNLDPRRDMGTLIEQLIRDRPFVEYLKRNQDDICCDPLLMSRNGDHPRQVLSVQLLNFADSGFLLLSRDITDISRADTTRRDFIANVSHELRTPLTVISGFLEQMTENDAPAETDTRRFLAMMHEQARRMNRLVEDLLTLSRLENATEPPRDETVDLATLLDTLLAEAQALSAGRHTVKLAGSPPTESLIGSSDELRSAFGNLVSNAIRYTPPGGCVTLSWSTAGSNPMFCVSDTGIGIPSEHIPRLSERFYRVDKGRSTTSGGTGLGLAIVKHVLARHQGSLQIHSEAGQGSTFCACLPVTRVISSSV